MTETPRELDADVVSTECATLERQITIEESGALISFTIDSDLDHPVLVRVVDEFPTTIAQARWMPEFEPVQRSLTPTGVVFEAVVPEDEPVTVQYRVHPEDPEIVEDFPPPEITLAQPIDDAAADVSVRGSSTAGFLDAGANDGPATPATPETPIRGERTDGAADETEAPVAPAAADESADFLERDGGPGKPSAVLERLISELQDPEVSEERLSTLRDELQVEHPRSMEVRLGYLQSRVNDFEAYADTLETMIDEHGTPGEFADAVTSEHEEIHRRLGAIDEQHATAAEERAATEARLQETIEELDAVRDELEDELADIRAAGAEREDAITTLREEVQATNAEVTEVDSEVGQLRDDLEREVEGLERELDQTVDEIEDWMTDELETLSRDIAGNHEDLVHQVASLERRLERQLEKQESRLSDAFEELSEQFETKWEDVEGSLDSLSQEVEENAAARAQFAEFLERVRSLGMEPPEAVREEASEREPSEPADPDVAEAEDDESEREDRDSDLHDPGGFYT